MFDLRLSERGGQTGAVGKSSAWPMWVIGLAVLIDNVDQYIVRGASNQIEHSFRVGDFEIAVLFSAFILVNGIVTMPAGYLADRWNRTRAMAVTIAAWSVISAVGGLVLDYAQRHAVILFRSPVLKTDTASPEAGRDHSSAKRPARDHCPGFGRRCRRLEAGRWA